MAEVKKLGKAKTFVIAAMNDNKVSIEEAVQTFESLASLSKLQTNFRAKKNTQMQPNFSCTFQAFVESLQFSESS